MPAHGNILLDSLEKSDQEDLSPLLESVALQRNQVVESPGNSVAAVYFPESSVISVVAHAPHRRIEVGLIGFDGMTGFSTVLGDSVAANEMVVQVPGEGWRLPADALTGLLRSSSSLSLVLLRYVHAFLAQASQTALANGSARLEERLSRWLLMAQDRYRSDNIEVTHDFLSRTLGVRRAGVTVGLQMLESKDLIRARRRLITILDRQGLMRHANGSYGHAEVVYGRLFGEDWRRTRA